MNNQTEDSRGLLDRHRFLAEGDEDHQSQIREHDQYFGYGSSNEVGSRTIGNFSFLS